jgi:hypothetical protein
MTDPARKMSNHVSSGRVDGTGLEIEVMCGFKPKAVLVWNVTGLVRAEWDDLMPDGYMVKIVDASVAGAVAITPHADSGGSITVTPHADSAGTPAEATAATVANAASDISAAYLPDVSAIVKPAIKLTYIADPAGAGDGPLFVVEGIAGASENCGALQSTTAASADVLGETADGSVFGAAGSARFWVFDNAAPAGVQIYVNEASAYQLECVSPTGEDVIICMPMENAAGLGSAYCNVVVHHSAAAAGGVALYFEDGGAADAQLVFVATDTADHAIPPSDISVSFSGVGVGAAGGFGSAAAQIATVTPGTYSALGDHSHASTAALDGTHSHASTAAFTGSAGGMSYAVADGITPMFNGFKIGADADLNVALEDLFWVAIK